MTQRRFIAGVVCPVCGITDRTVVEVDSEGSARICVVCDYREENRIDSNSAEPAHHNASAGDSPAAASVIRLIIGSVAERNPD